MCTRFLFAALFCVVLSGCNDAPSPPPPAAASALAQPTAVDPPFVGKVWTSTTRGDALGAILIFLPDRTLLLGSCVEPYRLSQWGGNDKAIRWLEDTIPIQANVWMPRKDQLLLQVAGQEEERSYIAASVPFACPDMQR